MHFILEVVVTDMFLFMIFFLIVIDELITSSKKLNNMCIDVANSLHPHEGVIFQCLFPSSLRNSEVITISWAYKQFATRFPVLSLLYNYAISPQKIAPGRQKYLPRNSTEGGFGCKMKEMNGVQRNVSPWCKNWRHIWDVILGVSRSLFPPLSRGVPYPKAHDSPRVASPQTGHSATMLTRGAFQKHLGALKSKSS